MTVVGDVLVSDIKVDLKETPNGCKELIFRSGDRFQAISITPLDTKEKIVGLLHTLAENIKHDELFTTYNERTSASVDLIKSTL